MKMFNWIDKEFILFMLKAACVVIVSISVIKFACTKIEGECLTFRHACTLIDKQIISSPHSNHIRKVSVWDAGEYGIITREGDEEFSADRVSDFVFEKNGRRVRVLGIAKYT